MTLSASKLAKIMEGDDSGVKDPISDFHFSHDVIYLQYRPTANDDGHYVKKLSYHGKSKITKNDITDTGITMDEAIFEAAQESCDYFAEILLHDDSMFVSHGPCYTIINLETTNM